MARVGSLVSASDKAGIGQILEKGSDKIDDDIDPPTIELGDSPGLAEILKGLALSERLWGMHDAGKDTDNDDGDLYSISEVSVPITDDLLCRHLPMLGAGTLATCTMLNLDGNEIGDTGAAAIADALARGAMEAVEAIWLSNNRRMADVGLTALANAACNSLHQLSHLWLEGNSIGDDGTEALADACSRGAMPALTVLDLTANRLGNGGIAAIAWAACPAGSAVDGRPSDVHVDAQRNSTGATTDQARGRSDGNNENTAQLMSEPEARFATADSLRYLMREGWTARQMIREGFALSVLAEVRRTTAVRVMRAMQVVKSRMVV